MSTNDILGNITAEISDFINTRIKGGQPSSKVSGILNNLTAEASDFINNPSKLDRMLVEAEEAMRGIPKVGETLSGLPVMIAMAKSWIKKEYEVSPKVLAIMAGAFLYLEPVRVASAGHDGRYRHTRPGAEGHRAGVERLQDMARQQRPGQLMPTGIYRRRGAVGHLFPAASRFVILLISTIVFRNRIAPFDGEGHVSHRVNGDFLRARRKRLDRCSTQMQSLLEMEPSLNGRSTQPRDCCRINTTFHNAG